MELFSKDNINIIKNQDMENSSTSMEIHTPDKWKQEKEMEEVSWNLKMEGSIKEIGSKIKCMELEPSSGLQVIAMKDNI